MAGGHLRIAGQALSKLEPGARLCSLDLSGCQEHPALPEGLEVGALTLRDCKSLRELPSGLKCVYLNLRGSGIVRLPRDLQVRHTLDLEGCTALRQLPARLRVTTLNLRGCTALTLLPPQMRVELLILEGCTALYGWPEPNRVRLGRLLAADCPRLLALPSSLTRVAHLDVRGCTALRALPADLEITGWVDVGGSGLRDLPRPLTEGQLRWRGVSLDADSIFRPETITAARVLGERNTERRRVLLERMGLERFVREAGAAVLDTGKDAGGPQELLRVDIPREEALVCLSVRCPSTGRQYLLRVPPTTATCRQASAWLAGFDNPDDYSPALET